MKNVSEILREFVVQRGELELIFEVSDSTQALHHDMSLLLSNEVDKQGG